MCVIMLSRRKWAVFIILIFSVLALMPGSTNWFMIPTTTAKLKSETLKHLESKRKNVVFIIADDLRAQIGSLNDFPSRVFTPNLDLLARRSLLLANAHVQFTLCGPSRTSILTSRRPDTTKVYYNNHNWRKLAGDFTTLPQYFKEHGYKTRSFGKVFHSASVVDDDYPKSWTQPSDVIEETQLLYNNGAGRNGAIWKAVTGDQLEQVPLDDMVAVAKAKAFLEEVAKEEQPFFVAIGFKKPHLPHICPQEFFDLYKLETDDQFLSDKSWQTPIVRIGCYIENTTAIDEYTSVLDEDTLRYYRKSYFACASYTDDLVGQILDAIDVLELRNSTIVSFVSDHGYHLGENGIFGKQTLYDASTHVPMMVSVPGRTAAEGGIVSNMVVETLDLFPTLVDAAGLPPIPKCPRISLNISTCTQGSSLLHLVENPGKNESETETETFALSQVRPDFPVMQYSLRTGRYRFTQWARSVEDGRGDIVRYDLLEAEEEEEEGDHVTELYDLEHDREETINRSQDPGYSEVKRALQRKLREVWNTFN